MSYVATTRSMVLDLHCNHGSYIEIHIGIRQLEFFLSSVRYDFPSTSGVIVYTSAGSYYASGDEPMVWTDTSKTGSTDGNGWMNHWDYPCPGDCQNANGEYEPQRVVVVFPSLIDIDELVYNNHHQNGGSTGFGAKTVDIYTTDQVLDQTHADDVLGAVPGGQAVWSGDFLEHIGGDIADDQSITFSPPSVMLVGEAEGIHIDLDITTLEVSVEVGEAEGVSVKGYQESGSRIKVAEADGILIWASQLFTGAQVYVGEFEGVTAKLFSSTLSMVNIGEYDAIYSTLSSKIKAGILLGEADSLYLKANSKYTASIFLGESEGASVSFAEAASFRAYVGEYDRIKFSIVSPVAALIYHAECDGFSIYGKTQKQQCSVKSFEDLAYLI